MDSRADVGATSRYIPVWSTFAPIDSMPFSFTTATTTSSSHFNPKRGAAKTRLTSLDVSRNSLGRQGAAALAAGLDEGRSVHWTLFYRCLNYLSHSEPFVGTVVLHRFAAGCPLQHLNVRDLPACGTSQNHQGLRFQTTCRVSFHTQGTC